MKTFLLTFFSLLILGVGEQATSKELNYLDYHKEIIRIEEIFICGNTDESLKLYKSLFSQYIPFARDCFIALQLACSKNDTSYARFFFYKSFFSGVTWSTIQQSEHILTLLGRNTKYHHSIYEEYKKIRKQYLQGINFPLRAHYQSLVLKDYCYHGIRQFWEHKETSDSLYAAITLENVNSLVALTKEYGLKFERSTGIRDQTLDVYGSNDLDLQLTPQHIVLFLHNGCAYFHLKNELIEAIKNGELHPRIYALIYEFAIQDMLGKNGNSARSDYSRFYRSKCVIGVQDKFYNMFPEHGFHDHKDLNRVNRDRAEISMSSVEHDKKKFEFGVRNKLTLFFGTFKAAGYVSGI